MASKRRKIIFLCLILDFLVSSVDFCFPFSCLHLYGRGERERETFENVLLLKVLDLHLVSVFVCGVISICRGVLLVSMDRLSRFSSLEMATL